jgi:hypothetical protein
VRGRGREVVGERGREVVGERGREVVRGREAEQRGASVEWTRAWLSLQERPRFLVRARCASDCVLPARRG